MTQTQATYVPGTISRYTMREQTMAMRAMGDSRHLSRDAYLVALVATLVRMYGVRS